MKIEDVDIYDLPIWACAVVDEIDETCRKRLKESPEYSRILKESDELLLKYPFISKIIDRDEINEPIELSVEKARALSQFLALDADREDYERIQLYLMGCQYTLGVLQLLEIL
mgnify:CR=1 FL=1